MAKYSEDRGPENPITPNQDMRPVIEDVREQAQASDQKYLDARRLTDDCGHTQEQITRAMNIDADFERWGSDGGSPVFINPYFD